MQKKIIVKDWKNGYVNPYPIDETLIAFNTPHYIMQAASDTESSEATPQHTADKQGFSPSELSVEDIIAFKNPPIHNPEKLVHLFKKANLSPRDDDYLLYFDLWKLTKDVIYEYPVNFTFSKIFSFDNPVDAYIWFSFNVCRRRDDTYCFQQRAADIAEYLLGQEKKKNYMGHLWDIPEGRRLIRALASFADFLHDCLLGKELEMMKLLEIVLEYDLTDHIGARFLLMNLYADHKVFDKMITLFTRFPNDSKNPYFLYPMTYRYYKTLGPDHPLALSFLHQSIEANGYIIPFLGDMEFVPFFEGPSYAKQSLEEAYYFYNLPVDYMDYKVPFYDWLTHCYR